MSNLVGRLTTRGTNERIVKLGQRAVTISWSNQNRKYNSNMAVVRFRKSEVVITQPLTELAYQNLKGRRHAPEIYLNGHC